MNKDIEPVKTAMIGVEHREDAVLEKLKEIRSSEYFNKISEEELTKAFF